MRVEHQSTNTNHLTPPMILERVRTIGPIKLDPATTKANPTGAEYIRTPDCDPDGLATSWREFDGLVFVNPPYGRKKNRRCNEWVYKAIREACPETKPSAGRKGAAVHKGAEIIMLLPARTDTQWFQTLWKNAVSFCFIKGRLTFQGETNGAPFPSVLAYLGPHPKSFADAFRDLGFITPWRIV